MVFWFFLYYCWVINGSYVNKGLDVDDCIDFLMGKKILVMLDCIDKFKFVLFLIIRVNLYILVKWKIKWI